MIFPYSTTPSIRPGYGAFFVVLWAVLSLVLSQATPAVAHDPVADAEERIDSGSFGVKIVNGRVVNDPGNYGLVQVLTTNQSGNTFRCGGTALANNWVATSAHCIAPDTTQVQVYANPVDGSRRKNGLDVSRVVGLPGAAAGQDHASTDLVLLEVPHLPQGVQAVPVVVSGQPDDQVLTGVGFGRHNYDYGANAWIRVASVSAVAIDMPLQPRTLCTGGKQGEAIVCAGKPWDPRDASPRDDFCTGDSGSPLGDFVSGRFAVVGIESRSSIMNANPSWNDQSTRERCGFAPTMATSLRHHLPFLQQVIGHGLMTVSLPHSEQTQTNTLDAGAPRGGVDLRIPTSGGDINQGVRVALQIARARYARNASVGHHVLLASNRSFADALSSAALQRDSILLFTPGDQVPNSVIKQLQSMKTRRVSVLGGPAIISEGVVHQLRTIGIQVDRIAGSDRLATSAAIASRLNSNKRNGSGAYLVRAFGQGSSAFADSLAAGAAASRRGWPVLLTSSDSISSPTVQVMNHRPEITIVGGSAAISDRVRLQVASMIPRVNQAQGADRTKTAELLATPASHNHSVIVIDGFDLTAWHGGFAASGLAADIDAPILLTNPATNGADIAAQLDGMSPSPDASFVCIANKALCDSFYHLWLN